MHAISDFVTAHTDQERGSERFELENPTTLQVNLRGMVYAKSGPSGTPS